MNDATLIDWPVAALSLSPLNPRREVDPDGIEALADSIRVCGLMQNLAGLRDAADPFQISIVAGGRRMRALQKLMTTGEAPETVPVLVTSDAAQARAWAMAENTARTDLNPADEISAYARMAREGMAVPAIAAAFAVSETLVQRRLKLASLPEDAIEALRERKISLSQAGALTLARGTHAYEDLLGLAIRDQRGADALRRIALDDVVTTDDRRVRFVGVDAYTTAGGALTRDLFSDVAVIEDFPLLERLFAEKVDATRAKFLERGWAWAEFVDGTYLPYGIGAGMERRYSELSTAQRAVCGVFFFVSVDGVCDMGKDSRTWAGGFIRREDRARAIEAGVLSPPPEAEAPGTGDDAATDPGAGFSAALLADLRAIRLHAFHEAMLENRDTALELIAYALSPCSGLAQGLLDVSVRAQKNAPDNADGFDGDPRLGSGPASAAPVPWADRVVDDPESKIAAALVPALTYGLSHGARDPDRMALFRDFEQQLGTDMRAFWTPTRENFFARVPAAVLEAIYAQIFALAPADEDARAFARMKKGAKANLLHMLFNGDEKTRRAYRLMTDDAMARISAWTPEFD